MVKVKCHRCKHEWEYSGEKVNTRTDWPQYVQCPKCRTTTKLKKEAK